MSKKLLFLAFCALLVVPVNTAMAYGYPDPDPNWPDQNDYRIARSLPPTIDGIISPGEWDKAEWIHIGDTVYGGETWPNCFPNDLNDVHWANLWNPSTNLIYCVVYGTDREHNFRDAFNDWNTQDDLEIYIDAANKDVGGGYSPVDGQHINMGPTTDGSTWCNFDEGMPPGGYAAGVVGDVITYEFALTPYDTFDTADPGNSTIVDLDAGHWLGLDMCMVTTALDTTTTTFMCEHSYPVSLWSTAANMLDHELVNALDTTVAHVESPGDNAIYVSPEVTLHWMAGDYADEHDVYFGTSFEDVNDANTFDPEYIATLALESNSITRTVFYPAGELALAQTYYWRIDEVNGTDPCSPWKGNVWNFVVDAGQAKYPDPADETPDVTWTVDGPTLSWTKGLKSVSNDVYFGDSYDAVNDAEKSDSEYIGNQTDCNIARADYHSAGPLVMNETYYWRIDSINDLEARSPWKGNVWSFTLKNHIVLDDFESYTSTNELGAVWKDYDTQAAPRTYCYAYVNGDPAVGAQSMMLACYNLFPPFYSEVRQTFPVDQDWSATCVSGVKALSLLCYGDSTIDPTDYLYVWLKDSAGRKAVQRLSDPDLIKTEAWTEINLALSDFTSPEVVDLSQIRTIAIGVGQEPPTPSTIIWIFIDDVRLYIPRCVPGRGGAGDLTGDCITNFKDLKYLTKDWGTYTWDVNVIAPVNAPCLWYEFNGDATDSSGNGYDGNIVDDVIEYGLDRNGQVQKALMFDGSETYVDVGVDVFTDIYDVNGEANEITVSLWHYGEPGVTKTHRHLFFGHNIAEHPEEPNDTWEYVKLNLYFLPNSNTVHVAIGNELYDPNDETPYQTQRINKDPQLEDVEGKWNHWAITKDCNSGELKVYLNGALWLSGTGMYHPVHNVALFWLGAESGREDDPPYDHRGFMAGKMDDFQIYDYALSQGEVCSLAGITLGSTYHQPMQLLLAEENINTNIYDDYQIDFKDFAMLATTWLDYVVWP